ncbi:MAG: hypothetical protein ACTHKT_04235 [Solirubrobacterales bacterium]
MEESNRLRSRRASRRLLLGIPAFAVVALVTYLVAHPQMFTGYVPGDDEGYMLTALKSFLHHGSLYDHVYTQYGPFYFEAWGAVFSLFPHGVTHDAGRTVTVGVWVVSSLVIGLTTVRLTGSILLGLAAQMLVFATLQSLGGESMHPGGLICLLLAVILAVASLLGSRSRPEAMGAIGAACAALLLVKVNIGVFALTALALACVVSYPILGRRRGVRLLVEVGFVALPFLVTMSKLGEGWARHYAVHVAIAALCVVVVLRARRPVQRSREELAWLVGGFLVTAFVICLAIVAAGTSPSGLVEGVVLQPLHLADVFTVPLKLPSHTYWLDGAALAGAVGYGYLARRRRPGNALASLLSVASVLIGVEMALSVIGKGLFFGRGEAFAEPMDLLAFAWVGLLALPGSSEEELPFAWLLLPPLAVLQALHAFPIAGGQIFWGAMLEIPLAAICVANGARGLAATVEVPQQRRLLAIAGTLTGTALFAFLVNTTLREPLRKADDTYADTVSLALPGAESIHEGEPAAASYRSLSQTIAERCPAFLTLPGMDSFYLWANQEPPTGFNATAWPLLLDDATQRQVIREVRDIRGLCLLRHKVLAEYWSQGKVPQTPLVRYLGHGFRPIDNFGEYELLQRHPGGVPR